ncbi:MAG: RNA polymerase sigma factor [Longimicrobiales bacterium]
MKATGQQQMTDAGHDETALIDRARAGDRDAQEDLVRRHLGHVFDLAYRILGDRDAAQDATQDAMISALGALGRFRGDASFRTWLLRITVNAAKTQFRRQFRRSEVKLTLASDVRSEAADPALAAVLKSEAARASAQLAKLPPKQRMAVVLRTSRGLSYAEVGEILECSEGAARVNYHLGIKRLRELLQ